MLSVLRRALRSTRSNHPQDAGRTASPQAEAGTTAGSSIAATSVEWSKHAQSEGAKPKSFTQVRTKLFPLGVASLDADAELALTSQDLKRRPVLTRTAVDSELRTLCGSPERFERVCGLLAMLESRRPRMNELQRRLSIIDELKIGEPFDGGRRQWVWTRKTLPTGEAALERHQADAGDLSLIRTALTATVLRDIRGQTGRTALRRRMFNVAVDLWNDHRKGKAVLGVDERLAMAEALVDARTAITSVSARAARLRRMFLNDPDVLREARARTREPVPFSLRSAGLLDCAGIEPEPTAASGIMETRPSEFVTVDHVFYRLKDSDYGQYRLAKERKAGLMKIMLGLAAPMSRLAINADHLFAESIPKRRDLEQLRREGQPLVFFASPVVDGYLDLGSFVRNAPLVEPIIERDCGPEHLKRYRQALARLEQAEKALRDGHPLDPPSTNPTIRAERKVLDDMRAVLSASLQRDVAQGRRPYVEFKETIDRLRRLRAAEADPPDNPNAGVRALKRSRDAVWEAVLPPSTDLREETRIAEQATREQALAELDRLDANLDRRAIELARYNSKVRMWREFPDYLTCQMQTMHTANLATQDFDALNWDWGNTGFATEGDPSDWVVVAVDHGNALDPGFGGAETKVDSFAYGNLSPRAESPIPPLAVLREALEDDSMGITLASMGTIQRGEPIAGSLLHSIEGQTRAASDGRPSIEEMFRLHPELLSAVESAYRHASVPDEAYRRLAIETWPGGVDGQGVPGFRKVSGKPSRTAAEEAAKDIGRRDRAIATIAHGDFDLAMKMIALWKAANPERATQIFNEVAAGVQAVTVMIIDQPSQTATGPATAPGAAF